MKHLTDATTFEGFSNRVTDGSDKERIEAYGRCLDRLRNNQDDIQEGGEKTGQSENQSKQRSWKRIDFPTLLWSSFHLESN